MIQQMMPSHREAERRAAELQELNLRVMRFADEYAGRVTETMSAFQATVTHIRASERALIKGANNRSSNFAPSHRHSPPLQSRRAAAIRSARHVLGAGLLYGK
jgi:hypothetical protein